MGREARGLVSSRSLYRSLRCLDASLNVGGPGGTAGEGRLKGVSQAREAPVDDGVLYDCHKQSIQIQLECNIGIS